MNKKLIAVAVAAAFAAPMAASADATIYGAIHTSVQFNDLEGQNVTIQDNVTVESNDGALGIKGSEDLGNGLTAVYKIEANFAGDDGSLPSTLDEVWVGLSGGWGTAAIGRDDHPYKNVLNATGYNPNGDKITDLDAMNDRVGAVGFRQLTADNAIVYISPNFSGFSGTAALVAVEGSGAPGSTTNDGFDAYSIGANYAGGGLKAGLAWEDIDISNPNAETAWVLGASYTFGGFTIGGAYEEQEDVVALGGPGSEAKTWGLSGTYAFGNNVIGVNYVSEDQDNPAGVEIGDIEGWGLTAAHNMSNRTQVYAAYADSENDVTGGRAAGDEDQRFSLGVIHSF